MTTLGDNGPTFAMRLTPAGRSAVAVVLVVGPRAVEAVDACFTAANGKPLSEQPPDAIRFGRWGAEELVVCRRSTPRGEPPRVEAHCHGGHAAVRAVLDDLIRNGCVETDADRWRRGAGAAAIATAAERLLPATPTERAAGVLLDQIDGALERRLRSTLGRLERSDPSAAADDLRRLLDTWPVGAHLTTPWRVAIVGPPNVGKSSLLNALIGFEQALVYDRPGTTRDVVTALTAIHGWPVQLLDTAGLRETDDDLEAAGVELARETLHDADLILVVAEVGAGAEASWRATEAGLPTSACRLRVASKADLVSAEPLPFPEGWLTAAVASRGIGALIDRIGEALVPRPPAPGDAVVFLAEQLEGLQQAVRDLDAGDLDAARSRLQALLAPAGS